MNDLEYFWILFENLHWSFDTPKQLPGPSNSSGDGRKVARRRRTGLLRLVYEAHLFQVLTVGQQDIRVLVGHIQLTCCYPLKLREQLKTLFRLETTQH